MKLDDIKKLECKHNILLCECPEWTCRVDYQILYNKCDERMREENQKEAARYREEQERKRREDARQSKEQYDKERRWYKRPDKSIDDITHRHDNLQNLLLQLKKL